MQQSDRTGASVLVRAITPEAPTSANFKWGHYSENHYTRRAPPMLANPGSPLCRG